MMETSTAEMGVRRPAAGISIVRLVSAILSVALLFGCRMPPFNLALLRPDDGSPTADSQIPPGGQMVSRWVFAPLDPLGDSSGNGIALVDGGNISTGPHNGRDAITFTAANGSAHASDPLLGSITNGQSVSYWYFGNNFPQSTIVSRVDTTTSRIWAVGPLLSGGMQVVDAAGYLGGSNNDFSAAFPSSTVWHHVAVAFDIDADEGRIYVNGSPIDTLSPVIGDFSVAGAIHLGELPPGPPPQSNQAPSGEYLSDVRIYNYALTDAQVAEIFAEG